MLFEKPEFQQINNPNTAWRVFGCLLYLEKVERMCWSVVINERYVLNCNVRSVFFFHVIKMLHELCLLSPDTQIKDLSLVFIVFGTQLCIRLNHTTWFCGLYFTYSKNNELGMMKRVESLRNSYQLVVIISKSVGNFILFIEYCY